jgi:membrane protein DedA with SNARE-associated domain/rhodanese-related sulfurtransferase
MPPELSTSLLLSQSALLLFLNVFGEQMGLPIPAYPSLILAGAMAGGSGLGSILILIAVAALACLLADCLWYWAGKHYGNRLMRFICKVSQSPDSCIGNSRQSYMRRGPRILLVAKFLPGAGALATLMAGASGTPLRVFIAYDLAGSILWVSSGVALGMAFEDTVLSALTVLGEYLLPGTLVLAMLATMFLAAKVWRRQRLMVKSRLVPRIDADELACRQAHGEQALILEVGAGDTSPAIPGALQVALDAKLDSLAGLTERTLVVVYCACPNELSAALFAGRLRARGVSRSFALRGGSSAWQALELPRDAPLAA